MADEDAGTLAGNALEAAKEAGAGEAEACVERTRSSVIKVHGGKPSSVKVSETFGIGVRVFREGRTGFFNTCIPARVVPGVKELVEAVVQADPDPCAGLPEPPFGPFESPDIFDERLAALGNDEKIETLIGLEAEVLDADPRLVSKYFTFHDEVEDQRLVNTRGLDASYRATSFSVVGVAGVKDERKGTRGFFIRHGRHLPPLAGAGREAAERALQAFGGEPIPPKPRTVVFDPMLASQFLSQIASAFLGPRAVRGETFLAGKEGTSIAPETFALVDHLGLAGAPGTLPFDGEGVAPERTVVVEGGVLTGFLYDTYWGRRAGKASTGNASRPGYRDLPRVSPGNLYVEPGEGTLEEIVASVDDGLLLLEAMNVGGVSVASGDYSVSASGVRIEKGKRTHPVGSVTIAGTLPEMLENIVAIGDDLTWRFPIACPTLAIEGLTVGG